MIFSVLTAEPGHFLKMLKNNKWQRGKWIIRGLGMATLILLSSSSQLLMAAPDKSPSVNKVKIALEFPPETVLNAYLKMGAWRLSHFTNQWEEEKGIKNCGNPLSKQGIGDVRFLVVTTSATHQGIYNEMVDPSSLNKYDHFISVTDDSTNTQLSKGIKGFISNEKGEPLSGVSVSLKGTKVGSTSDQNGRYAIDIPNSGVLIFSYVGFETQEISVLEQTTIDIQMRVAATSKLNEVVVTALGIKREARSLTYSTQSVNTKQLTEARELNVMNSLEGKVPGLTLNTSGSGLGADVRVVLRGDRSISGDSQPLYVIDGVPIRGNPANLSPDNIASLSVLKGPNAAALYGSAAQNGAIIIETKKGRAGGVNLSLNNTYQVLDPISYINYQHVYGQGNGGKYEKSAEAAWGPKMDGQMVDTWSLDPAQAGMKYAFTAQPNNRNDIFRSGFNAATNILASVGGEKTQTAFSYTFTNAKGIIPTNTLQRHNLSARMNNKLTQRLSLDTKIDYIRQRIDNSIDQGGSNFNPVRQIYRMPPNIRSEDVAHFEFIDPTGLLKQNWWNPSTTTGSNPYWMMYRAPHQNFLERVMAMVSATYDFSDALKLIARASYDGENGSMESKVYNNTFTRAVFGRYTVTQNNAALFNSDFLLSYTRDISKKWRVSGNFGGSIDKRTNSALSANTGTALLVPNFFTLSNSTMDLASYDPGYSMETQSLYAFGHVSYINAIFLDITGRNDWSSTLPAKNRSYFYPSVGWSAILSDLIPSFPEFISFAKLRASWAKVGNSAPPYMGGRTASFRAGGNNGYLTLSGTLPNTDLLPEETVAYEVGADLNFLKGRVGLNITAYKTNTRNQLFTVALPMGSGASQFFTNGGDVENKGVEILLSTTPVKTNSLKWDLNFNFAINHNRVIKISDERPRVVIGSDPYFKEFVIQEGKPYGELFSRGFQRDKNGSVFIGSDGLPLITPGRTVAIGNVHPDWQGGVSSSLTYKNFSVSILIDHRQGGVVASMTNAILAGDGILERTNQGREGGLVFGSNFFSNEKAILKDGTHNTIAVNAESFWKRVGGESAPVGEVFTYSATNTRLREVTIGYSLSKSLAQRLGVGGVRFSLVGRNLLFLYRASKDLEPDITVGTDPSSPGYSTFAPPTTRSFGANLQIDFK